MTIVLKGGSESFGQPLTNSSTQRTHRSSGINSRFNGGRYRRTTNSTIAGIGSSSSNSIGGHPLASADPSLKKEIKHRFEITAKLGSGTYGKVSLAFDHKTEREVAVKLIKKSAIENKQDLVRIRREIRIMSMLNHPNLIQIYEVFENKDKIILVMEYASGGELYDYVSKNGSLSEQEARRIFRQITSAVLYCHKNKVAHRDLKLENILLDSNNNAKIADFGLSNYFGQRNKLLSTFCGSPLYASPEIINGTPYKGPEVDCWSLGILLYTLVYGSMPFDGRDFNRMVRQIKRGAYYEPDTPSTASMLIRNMLRVNPDRRATIYDISGHWWLNLEENMPVIQELPENQIIDPTPLTERAEIMVVQELADETDVFMEFGHLSQTTRKKIEEFRKRRKEAEKYNENSPIKPIKNNNEDKSLRKIKSKEKIIKENNDEEEKEKNIFYDPLERLKNLENRLIQTTTTNNNNNNEEKNKKENNTKNKEILLNNKKDVDPKKYWHLETDTLNILMNQVLEQIEKGGSVSLNLIENIRLHPLYNERKEVKELLETIIETQKPIEITKRKISKNEKQNLSKEIKNKEENKKINNNKNASEKRKEFSKKERRGPHSNNNIEEERRWHSVEVGFSTDSSSIEDSLNQQQQLNDEKISSPPKFVGTRISHSEPYETYKNNNNEEEIEDEDEFYDAAADEDIELIIEGEIDELAEEVEQIEENNNNNKNNKKIAKIKPSPPKIIEKNKLENNKPSTSKIMTDSIERGLAKIISKGKYQYSSNDLQKINKDLTINDKKEEQFKIKNKEWMKSLDPDIESIDNSLSSIIAPKAEPEEEEIDDNNEEEEEEEEEENILFKPKPSTIIGFRTIHSTGIDGISKEAPIVQVKPQNSQPQSPINKNQIQQKLNNNQSSIKSPQQSPKPRESPEPSLRYESAAAYIRRKNRERRARNATIAITEDTWTTRFPSQEQPNDEPNSPRHKNSNSSGKSNGSGGYNNRNDENYSRQTYLDRRKSFHEMSPSNDETIYDRYAIAGGYFNSLVGNNYMPSNISRYEEEVYNAFNKQYNNNNNGRNNNINNNIWPLQQQQYHQTNYYGGNNIKEKPERFEVYKTMAERASEYGRNDLNQYQHRMLSGGSCYYPGERPLSSYAGGSIGIRSGGGGGGPSRLVDDLQQYSGGNRKSIYEIERPITPCNEYNSNYYSQNNNNNNQFEPESPPRGIEGRLRRKISGLRDVDGRRAHALRSQSNDHMSIISRGAYIPDELEQIEPISGNSRYTTPEIGNNNNYSDYSYNYSYHDNGIQSNQQYNNNNNNNNNRNSRRDQHNIDLLDSTPVRGILKNKQAYEIEPRGGQGRLRRHQSVDKGYLNNNNHSLDEYYNNNQERFCSSYSRRYCGSSDHLPSIISGTTTTHLLPSYQQQQSIYMDLNIPVNSNRDYDYDIINNNKKRGSTGGILNLGRRKTTEIRLGGPESTNISNLRKQSANAILLEEEFKQQRPRSPIECIKSLFNKNIQKKDNLINSTNYSSSRYSNNNNYTKRYGGTNLNNGGGRTDGRFGQNIYNGGNRNNAPNRWGYEDTHL